MPAIVLKAETGTTKSRREGNTTIVEKTVEKGVLTETHTGVGHRLNGKQGAKQTVTLSTAELKALKGDKAAGAKQVANINIQANKFMGQLEAVHQIEIKLMKQQLKAKQEQNERMLMKEIHRDKRKATKKEKRPR